MKYVKPEFDVTIYEIEDVITLSVDEGEVDPPAPGGDDWHG
jgi:hypothetical protein